jgi:carbon-monoxide dehydrogenase medium subunit
MYSTLLQAGELITAVSFPIPKRASYAKFKQGASRFALVGVFVADTAQGPRVAVTGAANGVFRHAGLEAALAKQFAPQSIAGVTIDASELNSDIHASAEYRAHLIKVQTSKAVQDSMS